MNKLSIFMVVLSMATGTAQAVDFIWYAANRQSSGDFNGCFNDGTHWFQGTVSSGATDVEPYGAANNALFQYGTGWTVTFPTDVDVYTNYAKFHLKVEPGTIRTFDGTGATYAHPYNEAGNYPYQAQFQVSWRQDASGAARDIMMTMNNSGTVVGGGDYHNYPSFEFTDFKFHGESTAGTKDMKIVFEKGTYNFLNPCGVNWNKHSQFPCVYFFGSQAQSCYLDKNEVVFEAGSTLKANVLAIQGSNAPTNIFRFAGGEHLISIVDFASRFNGWEINRDRTIIDFRVDDGAKVKVTNGMSMFSTTQAWDRVARTIVTTGSELSIGSVTAKYGNGEIRAEGGKITFGEKGLYDQDARRTSTIYPSSFKLVAENGGELVLDQGGGGKGFYFGNNLANDTSSHHVIVDDALLSIRQGSKIVVYGGDVKISNGGVVDNAGTFAVRGSDSAGAVPSVMTIDGSVVSNHAAATTMNIGEGASCANLVLTNGARLVYSPEAQTTVLRGDVHMYPGTVIDNGGTFKMNGVVGEQHTMVIDGATMTNTLDASFTLAGVGPVRLVVTNDAFLAVGGKYGLIFGGDGTSADYSSGVEHRIGTFDMYGGRIVQPDGTDAKLIRMGYQAGTKGTLNLYGGEIRLFKSGTSGNRVICGEYGRGEVNVYGGVLDCFRPAVALYARSGYDYSSEPESVFRVYGGEVISRSQGNGQMVGFSVGGDGSSGAANRKARLVLNGGIVTSYTIYGGISARNNGGTGWAAFEADGGTIRPLSAASPCMLFHFDEAKLGPKGLTVDSRGFNGNTLAQHVWTNKDGEKGMLRFVGAGYTTVTGNVEQVSYIVADGGTVRLQKLDGNALDTLVITNGGTVCVNANQRLSIKDFRDDGTGCINILDGCSAGSSYQMFVFDGEPSAEARAALALLVDQGRITGLGNGRAADLTFTEGAGGTYVAEMAVREVHDIVIPLEAGATSNATENVFCSGFDTIIADVGEGAALTLSGTYQYGPFKLIGGGKASFDDLADHLYDTFLAKYGVLEVTGPGARFWDGQLLFAQNSTNDVFVLKNDVDLTMPCPANAAGNGSGEFVKRGVGTLTFTIGAGQTNTLTKGHGKGNITKSYGVWGTTAATINQLEFDPNSDMVVNSGVPAFLVAEGELRIVGTGPAASVLVGGVCDVGISTATGTVQPGLVLDNVRLRQTTHPDNWFYLGHGINSQDASNPRSGDFALSPYLMLTNNATLSCAQFEIGRECYGNDVKIRFVVDGSTFNPGNWFAPNISKTSGQRPEVAFRNGSKVYTRWIQIGCDVDVDFDDTLIANNEFVSSTGLLYPITISPMSSSTTYTGTYNFRNNSVLYCNQVNPSTLDASRYRPVTLRFDNSTWIPTNQVADYTFEWSKPDQVLIAVTNTGLHLPVPATATWTMNQPVKGTGGVVMDGEGTLKFGSGAVAYTGVTRIDSGTVDLSSAGEIAALTVSGGGTLKDATVGALTLKAVIEDGAFVPGPTLDGVTMRRRVVDFQDQLSDAEVKALSNVVIGHYAGTAPSGTKWRIVGTPLTNARGQVSYENGDIVLQSVSAGPGSVFTFR